MAPFVLQSTRTFPDFLLKVPPIALVKDALNVVSYRRDAPRQKDPDPNRAEIQGFTKSIGAVF